HDSLRLAHVGAWPEQPTVVPRPPAPPEPEAPGSPDRRGGCIEGDPREVRVVTATPVVPEHLLRVLVRPEPASVLVDVVHVRVRKRLEEPDVDNTLIPPEERAVPDDHRVDPVEAAREARGFSRRVAEAASGDRVLVARHDDVVEDPAARLE